MADVQLEHGYTRIANRLLSAIAIAPWDSAAQQKVLGALIRVTYGTRRSEASIGLSEWRALTGLPDSTVKRALQSLEGNGVMKCVRQADAKRQIGRVWKLQKDFTHWKRYRVRVEDVDAAEAVAAEQLSTPPGVVREPGSTNDPGSSVNPGSPVNPDPGSSMNPGEGSPVTPGMAPNSLPDQPLTAPKERERKERHITSPPAPPSGVENGPGDPLEGEKVRGCDVDEIGGDSRAAWATLRAQLIASCLLGREQAVDAMGFPIGIGLLIDQAKWIRSRGYSLEEITGVVKFLRAGARRSGHLLGPSEPCSLAILVHREKDEETGEFTGSEDWAFWNVCLHEWQRSESHQPADIPAVTIADVPPSQDPTPRRRTA